MSPVLACCVPVYSGLRGKVDLIPNCSDFVALFFLSPTYFFLFASVSLPHFYTLLKTLLPFSNPPLFQHAISVYPSWCYSHVSNPSSSELLNYYRFAVILFSVSVLSTFPLLPASALCVLSVKQEEAEDGCFLLCLFIFVLNTDRTEELCVLAWHLDGTAVRKLIANHQSDNAEKMSCFIRSSVLP